MELNGIPLHPLVVHAVVVLTPLAGVLAVVYGVVPRWRWWSRWPLLVSAVGGAVATYVSSLTGNDLKDRLGLRGNLIESHETWAGRLQFGMWVLAAAVVVALVVLPVRNRIEGHTDKAARVGVLSVPLGVVLTVAGVLVMFLVFKTGDAGAQLVWRGTPG